MLSQYPQGTPQSSRSSKRILTVVIVVAVVAVVILGGIGGGIYFSRISQQPNIQATAINIPQPVANPQTSTVLNDGRVSGSASFSYISKLPGSYSLVFDNSFSTFSSKAVALTWADAAGASHTQAFTVSPGNAYTITTDMKTNQVISGSFSVSGGSGDDVNFYITAQTCTQSVTFTFTLVNSGSADGYATVQLRVDGQALWTNRYFVSQGQQLLQNGGITLSDCDSHSINLVVSSQTRA